MWTVISSLGGLLLSGLPKVLEYFQDRSDKKHEMAMAQLQTEREKELAALGFAAQAKVEEIRSDQIAMQTEAASIQAALDHDKTLMEKASQWVANFNGIIRPGVTMIFVLELVGINAWMCFYLWNHPGLINSIDDITKYSELVFSEAEMSLLAGIISYWFGSRGWSKK